MAPVTPEELAEFRELIFPDNADSETTRRGPGRAVQGRTRLANALGLDPSSVWRMEQKGSNIKHPLMMRRALVQIVDELGVKIPRRLRYGGAAKRAAGVR
jgi:hypothetical protein